jgi:hypothetical protein
MEELRVAINKVMKEPFGHKIAGIFPTTEEKARKNLSHGSRRMPVGTMKNEYTKEHE